MTTTADRPPELGTWVIDPTPPEPSQPTRRRRAPWMTLVDVALVVGLLAAGALLVTGGFGVQPVLTWRHPDSPGAVACEQIAAAHLAGGEPDSAAIIAGFRADDNAHLQRAGEAMAQLMAGQTEDLMSTLATITGETGAGCSAVGVDLPAGVFAVKS